MLQEAKVIVKAFFIDKAPPWEPNFTAPENWKYIPELLTYIPDHVYSLVCNLNFGPKYIISAPNKIKYKDQTKTQIQQKTENIPLSLLSLALFLPRKTGKIHQNSSLISQITLFIPWFTTSFLYQNI